MIAWRLKLRITKIMKAPIPLTERVVILDGEERIDERLRHGLERHDLAPLVRELAHERAVGCVHPGHPGYGLLVVLEARDRRRVQREMAVDAERGDAEERTDREGRERIELADPREDAALAPVRNDDTHGLVVGTTRNRHGA